jgi:hypothetical protein
MSEETVQEAPGVETPAVKTFTQEQLDGIIQARLSKVESKFTSELEAERQTRTELETKLQEKSASQMTDSEHRVALQKSLEATQAELNEFKSQLALEKEQKAIQGFDNADKQALLEAGGNPKYSGFLLDQIKSSRGIENGEAFYKDGTGAATDRGVVIEAIRANNPELFLSNRVKGNNVPHGEGAPPIDRSNETTEQYIARRNAERSASGEE